MSAIDLGMDFQMPKNQSSQIKVMGIGGGGSNAVNHMYELGIKDVDFIVCNTDSQALEVSSVPTKIQLGVTLTGGRGAGSIPDVGRNAAIENIDEIKEYLSDNTNMVFITAGMGGGTGTGAGPVVAKIAKDMGILTVGIVTVPFSFEGKRRKEQAEAGIKEMRDSVDTLLIINNEKLRDMYGNLTIRNAYAQADQVLASAAKGIAEVISQHLLVNIDLNDARKVLENSGTAVMGQAIAEGENRAIEAVMGALDSPLLNDNDITGAQQVLLKIVTGNGDDEIKMSELFKIKNKIQEAAGRNVNIIEGIGIDPELGAAVSVTVVATGFEEKRKPKGTTIVGLDEEDVKVNDKIESSLSIEPVVDLLSNDSPQHILDLEEEEYTAPIDELMTSVIPEEVLEIPQIEEDKKIVFELNIDEEEETPEQVISSILQEYPKVEMKTVVLEMDDEQEVETLRTLDSNPKVSPDNMKVEARERENRLRAISQQLRTPSGLTNLEDIPAYKRNEIELDETSHSAENEISTYTLSDGKNNPTEFKQNNSFLHDNVD